MWVLLKRWGFRFPIRQWLRAKGAGREGFGNIVQLFLHVFSKLILGREGRCVEVV